MTEGQEAIQKAKKLLEEAGFKVSVSGCGCCESPWFKLSYKGETILDDSNVNFDMFVEPLPKSGRVKV